jgi:hypothetical protein
VKAILSSRLVPGLGDHIAARSADDGQQTAEPVMLDGPDNLFHSVAGPFGAHGRYDARARPDSMQWWLVRRRLAVAATLALSLAAVAAAL